MVDKKYRKTNYLEQLKSTVGRLFAELESNIRTAEDAVTSLVKQIAVESYKNGIKVGEKKKERTKR